MIQKTTLLILFFSASLSAMDLEQEKAIDAALKHYHSTLALIPHVENPNISSKVKRSVQEAALEKVYETVNAHINYAKQTASQNFVSKKEELRQIKNNAYNLLVFYTSHDDRLQELQAYAALPPINKNDFEQKLHIATNLKKMRTEPLNVCEKLLVDTITQKHNLEGFTLSNFKNNNNKASFIKALNLYDKEDHKSHDYFDLDSFELLDSNSTLLELFLEKFPSRAHDTKNNATLLDAALSQKNKNFELIEFLIKKNVSLHKDIKNPRLKSRINSIVSKLKSKDQSFITHPTLQEALSQRSEKTDSHTTPEPKHALSNINNTVKRNAADSKNLPAAPQDTTSKSSYLLSKFGRKNSIYMLILEQINAKELTRFIVDYESSKGIYEKNGQAVSAICDYLTISSYKKAKNIITSIPYHVLDIQQLSEVVGGIVAREQWCKDEVAQEECIKLYNFFYDKVMLLDQSKQKNIKTFMIHNIEDIRKKYPMFLGIFKTFVELN